MLIIIGILLVIFVSIIIGVAMDTPILEVLISLGSMCLILCVLSIFVNQAVVRSQMRQFSSVISTIEYARKNSVYAESIALTLKIAEQNQWLASMQYWNKTRFDIWIPDDIELIEPIR